MHSFGLFFVAGNAIWKNLFCDSCQQELTSSHLSTSCQLDMSSSYDWSIQKFDSGQSVTGMGRGQRKLSCAGSLERRIQTATYTFKQNDSHDALIKVSSRTSIRTMPISQTELRLVSNIMVEDQKPNTIPSPKTTVVDLSPVVQHKQAAGRPTHRKSHSLVGFDPLLSTPTAPSTTIATAAPRTEPNLHHNSVLTQMPSTTLPLAPFVIDSSQASNDAFAAPPLPPKSAKRSHRKGSQTFCMSDLRSVSEKAMMDQGIPPLEDIFGLSSSSYHEEKKETITSSSYHEPKPVQKTDSAPSTPTKDVIKNESDHSKDKGDKNSKNGRSFTLTPQRARVTIPWIGSKKKEAKKSHRRAQSLQVGSSTLAALDATNQRSSVPNSPAPGVGTIGMDTMIQDLLTLDMSNSDDINDIAIPSLAKPLAHSFLRGKSEENLRTSEVDPSLHQTEIPTNREVVIAARLNEFAENYRRVDQNIDLQQWVGLSRLSLRQIKIPEHQPIAQALLECGDNVSLQGIITKGGKTVDDRLEAIVFEGERTFTVVFRGTTEEQLKPSASLKSKKGKNATVPIDPTHANIDVYSYFKDEYVKLEGDTFALLDRLTEQHPFCDVCFTGYSFGAAMATLAAVRYSNARPMMRVNCTTMASPKVGSLAFKQMVNSTPNLKMMRVELGQDAKCQLPSHSDACHAGHTLLLRSSLAEPQKSSSNTSSQAVVAYRFEAPKPKMFKTTHPDLRSYVNALEEIARSCLPWPVDFVGASQGVIVNNEKRNVV